MHILVRTLMAGLMACPVLGVSQNFPLFQFTLHIEDNNGNRDSIVLGYDPSASSQHLNPQFGEVLLNEPFDSIFEVRAIHGDDSQKRTSKKIIEDIEVSPFDSCVLVWRTKIVINAKFLPVKITYDSTLFPIGTCRNVILSPDWDIFFLQKWWDVCDYHCMAGSSLYQQDFAAPQPPFNSCWNLLYIEKEVEGQGLKKLPGLFFATFYGPSPCNDTTFLALKDDRDIGFGTLNPNPVSEHFSIQVPSDGNVYATVSDLTGSLITCPFTVSMGAIEFDARGLSPGIYFVSLQTGQKRQAVYKFVKM